MEEITVFIYCIQMSQAQLTKFMELAISIVSKYIFLRSKWLSKNYNRNSVLT